MKRGNKIQRTIMISPELDAEIARLAQRDVRSYTQQVEYMLGRSREYLTAEGTQLDTAALRDSELLERIR